MHGPALTPADPAVGSAHPVEQKPRAATASSTTESATEPATQPATEPAQGRRSTRRLGDWGAVRVVLALAAAVQVSALAGTLLDRLSGLLVLLLVSVVLACAIEPGVNALERRGVNRRGATAGIVLGMLALLGALVAGVGTAVSGQVRNLLEHLPELSRSLTNLVASVGIHIDPANVTARIEHAKDALAALAQDNAAAAASGLGSVAINVTTGLFVIYYLVADGPRLRQVVCRALPPHRQRQVLHGWEIALDKAGSYLSSRAALAAISVTVSSILFLALQVPYALALALWMGVISQTIPVIGTYLAAGLPILVALTVSPGRALWLVLALTAYQQVENFLIQPMLTRRSLRLHPAVAVVSVFAGTALLGAAGALIALPVLATVQAVLDTYLHRHELIPAPLLGARDDEAAAANADVPDAGPGLEKGPGSASGG